MTRPGIAEAANTLRDAGLGPLEAEVLVAVAACATRAYGVKVAEAVAIATHARRPPYSSIYIVLKRLEEKGYLTSAWSPGTQTRGGRRRRHYTLTKTGREALK